MAWKFVNQIDKNMYSVTGTTGNKFKNINNYKTTENNMWRASTEGEISISLFMNIIDSGSKFYCTSENAYEELINK